MEKIDLKDCTFLIPIRIDSDNRKENLTNVLKYLNKNFSTNIFIGEESSEPSSKELCESFQDVTYFHFKSDNVYFHRTKVLNNLTKVSSTPIIVNYDTDVLLKISQYVSARDLLKNDVYDVVYPYDGKFIDIYGEQLSRLKQSLDVEDYSVNSGNLIHPNSVGGAIFFNKARYFSAGLENQNFISWGFEDNERINRLVKLNYRIGRIDGHLYHMTHPPSINSSNTQSEAYLNNYNEYNKIFQMRPSDMVEYIKTFEWTK